MALPLIVSHIVSRLPLDSSVQEKPLFVAMQGPQGCGKTTVTSRLPSSLPPRLKTLIISLDDFYQPHDLLMAGTGLLKGRGLPGTHDIPLLLQVLHSLKTGQDVRVPIFDKSLHGGEGDRLAESEWISVVGKVDVVVLEGWCVCFEPLDAGALQDKWEDNKEKLGGLTSLEEARTVNNHLAKYTEVWSYFELFIQLAPAPGLGLSIIYTWRLQQEHGMKARNGGKGMSDEQVVAFIDRYLPAYTLFLPVTSWYGRGEKLVVILGENREVIGHDID